MAQFLKKGFFLASSSSWGPLRPLGPSWGPSRTSKIPKKSYEPLYMDILDHPVHHVS